MSVFFKSPIWR
nr:unnamed protein product [Callosobruchus analis]CAI5861871.1 unnamed protein product [Callosobruchus analis]